MVSGWAFDPAEPERILNVCVYDGDQLVATVPACDFRADLASEGFGSGHHAFRLRIPDGVLPGSRHVLRVTFEDGCDLPGSPAVVARASGRLDLGAEEFVQRLVKNEIAAAGSASDLGPAKAVVLGCLDALLAAESQFGGSGVRPSSSELGLSDSFRDLTNRLVADYPFLDTPACRSPTISIILPVRNRFAEVYRTINDLLGQWPATPTEVVVVDDASSDEMMLARMVLGPNVKLTRNRIEAGRLRSARAGVALARGSYLLFLDPSVRLSRGAVDELVGVMLRDSGVGVVGPNFVTPDGRIVQAGLSVGPLADVVAIGRGAAADEPRYRRPREVDYVSGRALATARTTWNKLAGFSEAYAPGGFEDADFCFKARDLGLRVLATGLALAETAPEDSTSLYDRWNGCGNRRLFLDRWFDRIEAVATSRNETRRQLLFIDDHFPTPERDAGSVAAFEHMLSLQRLGYDVTYLPGVPTERREEVVAPLERVGIQCLSAPFCVDVPGAAAYQLRPFDVVFFHRFPNAALHLEATRAALPQARIVVSVADLHGLRARREAAVHDDAGRTAEAEAIAEQEFSVLAKADRIITHSSLEAEQIQARLPGASVHVVPWRVVPRPLSRPFAEREGVAFVGSAAHPPNIDAVRLIRSSIWPGVRERKALRCFLIGGEHEDAQDAGIVAVGWVPDLTSALQARRLSIAPLRYGAGVKGKVLESLACGVPCIMSPVAAEGIPLTPELSHLVAKDETAMIEKIVSLHDDETELKRFSDLSIQFVEQHYSLVQQDKSMLAAIG
jgi:glycosyltransferase involved in cell wall biosynthesis